MIPYHLLYSVQHCLHTHPTWKGAPCCVASAPCPSPWPMTQTLTWPIWGLQGGAGESGTVGEAEGQRLVGAGGGAGAGAGAEFFDWGPLLHTTARQSSNPHPTSFRLIILPLRQAQPMAITCLCSAPYFLCVPTVCAFYGLILAPTCKKSQPPLASCAFVLPGPET